MKFKYVIIALITGVIFIGCGEKQEAPLNQEFEKEMNIIAEKYVKLVLKIGVFDKDYVDAYYGPKEWMPADSLDKRPTQIKKQQLMVDIDDMLDKLDKLKTMQVTEIELQRFIYMYKQLLSAKAKVAMILGTPLDFTQQVMALYDATPPKYEEPYFQDIIKQIDDKIPGEGDVKERLKNFRDQFIIPKDKVSDVFDAAIEECRDRTIDHIDLPSNESFEVEYVTDKPWGGYNWYKGNAFSLIQVNTDLPIYIDRAVDLAAHEGYPGHHVYNTLLEYNLVNKRGWKEFTVYPLFSPQSLIAEGSANYGVEVVLPGNERIKFEKEVLFPLAGLDASKADLYYDIMELLRKLSYANNTAAQHYIDSEWTKEETVNWLMKNMLVTKEVAEKKIDFIDKYGAYVINYNYGFDLIKNYIEKKAKSKEERWELFEHILSTPQTPTTIRNKQIDSVLTKKKNQLKEN